MVWAWRLRGNQQNEEASNCQRKSRRISNLLCPVVQNFGRSLGLYVPGRKTCRVSRMQAKGARSIQGRFQCVQCPPVTDERNSLRASLTLGRILSRVLRMTSEGKYRRDQAYSCAMEDEKDVSRRDFFKTVGVGSIATAVVSGVRDAEAQGPAAIGPGDVAITLTINGQRRGWAWPANRRCSRAAAVTSRTVSRTG